MPLVASGVTFGYRTDAPLLQDLSLEVSAGSSVGVMAPSGSGKSTLLAVLGGLRRAWGGTVAVEHAGPDTGGPLISWVFQDMHLLPHRTALDNVAVALLSQGLTRAQSEYLALAELDRFGVSALAGRLQRDLSGGESQRVALARAAIARPAVVLAAGRTQDELAARPKFGLFACDDSHRF